MSLAVAILYKGNIPKPSYEARITVYNPAPRRRPPESPTLPYPVNDVNSVLGVASAVRRSALSTKRVEVKPSPRMISDAAL